MWEPERWLAERRREIDRTFDFRYSVLPIVFANLLPSLPASWTPSATWCASELRMAAADKFAA
jgi:hypothetical protein